MKKRKNPISIREKCSKILISFSKLLNEPKLNKSLCLIFNGAATIIAIIFIVLSIMDYTSPLMILGICGCTLIILANVTDMLPSLLVKMAKRI